MPQLYSLRDEARGEARDLAILECYANPAEFFFELPPDADPWELPFILHEFCQRGRLTVDAEWSGRWVRSRLVPPERQNLGEVLRENGLDSYDELRLLGLTGGRCAQDSCYLAPLSREALPRWYVERLRERVTDAFALGAFRLVVTFADGTAALCRADEMLAGRRAFTRVLADEAVFSRVAVQAGGHGIRWGSQLEVPAGELLGSGQALPLGADDLARIAAQATCDTAEAAQILRCTRQNISDLVRRGKLGPIKTGCRLALFLRADLLKRR